MGPILGPSDRHRFMLAHGIRVSPISMTCVDVCQIFNPKMGSILGYSGPYRLSHQIQGSSRGEMCWLRVNKELEMDRKGETRGVLRVCMCMCTDTALRLYVCVIT